MIDLSSNILSFAGAGSVTAIALAALLLRVSLGGLFLAHAYLKYFIFTPKGAAGFFASLGVPGWFAYLTIAAETLGGIALIVGFPDEPRRTAARPDPFGGYHSGTCQKRLLVYE